MVEKKIRYLEKKSLWGSFWRFMNPFTPSCEYDLIVALGFFLIFMMFGSLLLQMLEFVRSLG